MWHWKPPELGGNVFRQPNLELPNVRIVVEGDMCSLAVIPVGVARVFVIVGIDLAQVSQMSPMLSLSFAAPRSPCPEPTRRCYFSQIPERLGLGCRRALSAIPWLNSSSLQLRFSLLVRREKSKKEKHARRATSVSQCSGKLLTRVLLSQIPLVSGDR